MSGVTKTHDVSGRQHAPSTGGATSASMSTPGAISGPSSSFASTTSSVVQFSFALVGLLSPPVISSVSGPKSIASPGESRNLISRASVL